MDITTILTTAGPITGFIALLVFAIKVILDYIAKKDTNEAALLMDIHDMYKHAREEINELNVQLIKVNKSLDEIEKKVSQCLSLLEQASEEKDMGKVRKAIKVLKTDA